MKLAKVLANICVNITERRYCSIDDLIMALCPHCDKTFAVDATFIDEVGEQVSCPMCRKPVVLDDNDAPYHTIDI